MKGFFYPRSVAVVGVSAKPDNLARNIMLNLIDFGYDGIVYPVGPGGGAIATRRIYKSVADIPDRVDMAVILVPARFVPRVMEECGQKGVRRAVVETAGFSEYSEQGKTIEDEVVAIAEKYGIRFIGPNCIGVINMENGFCVPFPRLAPFIRRGEVSIITQSGGVGMSIMNHMAMEGIGLNKFASAGNMLNVDAEDLLEYYIDDEATRTIFIYLEGIRDGRRLMELARRSPKPILVMKSNIGKLGQSVAASHTAALSSDDRVVDTAFRQCGITRMHDVTTLSHYMRTLLLPSSEFVPVQPQCAQPDVAHGALAHAMLLGQHGVRGYLAAGQRSLDDRPIDRLDSLRRLLRGLSRPTPGRRVVDRHVGLAYTAHWTLWPSLGCDRLLAQIV